ncbi:MAG: hypothetical protein ACYS4W_05575 [Planctomycetota bacterium]|jgi:hypothetical protein
MHCAHTFVQMGSGFKKLNGPGAVWFSAGFVTLISEGKSCAFQQIQPFFVVRFATVRKIEEAFCVLVQLVAVIKPTGQIASSGGAVT